ncbi:hypothetical protein VNI00_009561 [Paramarasmius palmivorus]|uniref:Uncharacterized protein n=1 Tax=Paramarasmius palmivorus TaxID=297713 RepID=A0AAW0CLY7_9AGAR
MGGFALYDGETFRGYIWDRDRGMNGDQPYEGQAEGYLEEIKAYHQKHHDDPDTMNDDADEKAPDSLPILHERSATINADQENRPLTSPEPPDLLEFLVAKGYITIIEDEVRDRSHADVISKSIAIVQTTWFILQVVTRAVAGLAVTELEIITVGFAILNFITYFLWWNKPLRVRHSIRVNWRPKDARIDSQLQDKRKSSFGNIVGSVVAYIWWEGHPTTGTEWLWQLTLLPIWIFVHIFLVSADLLSDEDDKDMAVLLSSRLHEDRPLLVIAVYGIAALFGAIHCIPWAFQFPTHTEQLLWRVAAVAVAAAPIVMAFLHGYEKKLWNSIPDWLNNITTAIAFLLAISYAVFRVTLVVLAFMALRNLPSSAYQTIQWTTFIPHIG